MALIPTRMTIVPPAAGLPRLAAGLAISATGPGANSIGNPIPAAPTHSLNRLASSSGFKPMGDLGVSKHQLCAQLQPQHLYSSSSPVATPSTGSGVPSPTGHSSPSSQGTTPPLPPAGSLSDTSALYRCQSFPGSSTAPAPVHPTAVAAKAALTTHTANAQQQQAPPVRRQAYGMPPGQPLHPAYAAQVQVHNAAQQHHFQQNVVQRHPLPAGPYAPASAPPPPVVGAKRRSGEALWPQNGLPAVPHVQPWPQQAHPLAPALYNAPAYPPTAVQQQQQQQQQQQAHNAKRPRVSASGASPYTTAAPYAPATGPQRPQAPQWQQQPQAPAHADTQDEDFFAELEWEILGKRCDRVAGSAPPPPSCGPARAPQGAPAHAIAAQASQPQAQQRPQVHVQQLSRQQPQRGTTGNGFHAWLEGTCGDDAFWRRVEQEVLRAPLPPALQAAMCAAGSRSAVQLVEPDDEDGSL